MNDVLEDPSAVVHYVHFPSLVLESGGGEVLGGHLMPFGFDTFEELDRGWVSVSNSSSGCDWELDQISAMGDPPHMFQISSDHRRSTAEGQRRVTLQ
jgi:hypothetical protein